MPESHVDPACGQLSQTELSQKVEATVSTVEPRPSGHAKLAAHAIDFTARTTGVTTGMETARAEVRKAQTEIRAQVKETTAVIAQAGEEIGVNIPRHLRAFLAKMPVVQAALGEAFSGVAIVGLGMIAVEQAKKIYEAFQHLHELPEQIGKDANQLDPVMVAGKRSN